MSREMLRRWRGEDSFAMWTGMSVIGLLVITVLATGSFSADSGSAETQPTFDEVARTGHEVSFEEVADLYGGPMSRAPVFSVKAHPEVVWVRPDMGIGMVANPIAFGVDSPPGPIRWREVERSLKSGYLPIVISRYRDGDLTYEQEAYTVLLNGGQVKTGHEKQVAMVRMSVVNTNPASNHRATWWAYVPATVATTDTSVVGGPPYFSSYEIFEVTGSLPAVPEQALKETDDILRDASVLLGVHEEDPGMNVTRYEKVLKFEMELLPGQKKSVNLKLSSNKKGFTIPEVEKLRKLDFFGAQDQRVLQFETILDRGTRIQVPEERVNRIYKAQILFNQMQMVQAADRDYYMPVLGYNGVWPWEAMKTLVPLDAMGYAQDTAKSLQYFIKMQGKFPPHGQVKTYDGVFSGTGTFEESGWEKDDQSTIYGAAAKRDAGKKNDFPGWMNWTGAVLYAFGEHYFYTNDREWLQNVAPALIKASNWIIDERQQTKQKDAQGQKVLQYGLLPAGQAYDTKYDKPTYYLCWTDAYTYQGLQRAAEALADIGNPEGPRLLKEAANYREDILEVMRRTRQTESTLPPYPERLYQPPDWADFATGPLALVDTGFMKPDDQAFGQLEAYMKKNFNRGILGLTGGLRERNEDAATREKGLSAYYVDFSEDIWQRAWMLRGETEKALLAFYSTLGYGVDKDTLGAVERFDLYDRRFAPFFMDASGASRVVGMIRQTLLLEQNKVLYLLAGAPRRWLEAGKTIEVKNGVTYFGTMDLKVDSLVDEGKVLVDLTLRKTRPERLQLIRLRIPPPGRERMKQVMVNGTKWGNFKPEEEVIELNATENRYQIVVQY
jgi:hypothetical protein